MDWIWIIIGLVTVCIFTVTAIAVTAVRNRSKASAVKERRRGYQDVLVKDGVDIKSLKYIHEVSMFPNQEGIEAFPTIMANDNMNVWDITLLETNTGNKYRCTFNGQLVIGRDPAAKKDETKFVVNDGSVSKTHCRIVSRGSMLELADLNSKNGTYINGKLLSGTGLLHSGDKITVGGTTFVLQIGKGQ